VVRTVHKEKYVVIQFKSQQQLDNALQKEIVVKEGDTPSHFANFETIKPPVSDIQKEDINNRTIQVIDIPLSTPTSVIRAAFRRHGTITKLTTRTRGAFQQAYITYESADDINNFRSTQWSDFIMRDAVRVLPITLSETERELRQAYCLKLSGLPVNTTAHEIVDFIKNIRGKTCFIPKFLSNYKPRNYAYINFTSEEDMTAAHGQNFSLKGQELFWCLPDNVTCNSCGSPDHFIKSCPHKKTRTARDEKLQKLYRRMKPAQHRKSPKSYADAAKKQSNNKRNSTKIGPINKNISPLRNQHGKVTGTAAGGSMHDSNAPNLNEIVKTINAIQSQFAAIQKDISELNRKFAAQQQKPAPSSPPSGSTTPSRASNATTTSSSPTKRTHSDVDTSSAEEPNSSNNEAVTQDQVNSINNNVASMGNMISSVLSAFAQLRDSGFLGGEAMDDEEEMDFEDEAEAFF
jgi:hypothetical protein